MENVVRNAPRVQLERGRERERERERGGGEILSEICPYKSSSIKNADTCRSIIFSFFSIFSYTSSEYDGNNVMIDMNIVIPSNDTS
jgi:hypothetical protein